MDMIGGAKLLSQRFEQRGVTPETARDHALVPADAIPLFHWVGVSPVPKPEGADD